MKKKLGSLKIVLFFLLILFSGSLCLAQDSLDPHFTPENLPFKDQKRRLDIAAKFISSDSNKIILLIGRGKKESFVRKNLQKSKRYLLKKYKLSADSIKTLLGGTQSDIDLQIRIFIVDKDSLNSENLSESQSSYTKTKLHHAPSNFFATVRGKPCSVKPDR